MEMNATQKDAANVLGRSARWLNDQHEAPRNQDKTYPLCELVAWFVDRESESNPLKDEKLREEINVLRERNRKLQFENEEKAGNLADIRLMAEMLTGLSVPMRKLGDMLGRKSTITGIDAQQMLNQTITDYERLLREQFGEQDKNSASA